MSKLPGAAMSLFMITFFAIYSSFHIYAFVKIRSAISISRPVTILLACFMLLMIVSPVVIRLSEKAGYETLARLAAYVGYTWFGLIFLFVSAALAIDCWRLLVWAGTQVLSPRLAGLQASPQVAFFLPLAAAILISCYGYFEALDIRTEYLELRSPKIPKAIGRIRIAQISDVHLGLIVREKRLDLILQAVNNAAPDLLVSTGDLVDGQISRLNGLAEMLAAVQPQYGKFAVTGNHEYYAGLDQALKFTRDAGFTILHGQGISITDALNVVGVDDQTGVMLGQQQPQQESEILQQIPADRFTLMLKHRPRVEQTSLGLFDLQLSGHTHKGQLFPFNIVTWFYFPTHAGCLNPVDSCYLYVSRGSGTWGPPVRFLSPPEVTVIDLLPE